MVVNTEINERIVAILKKAHKKPLEHKRLYDMTKGKGSNKTDFNRAVRALKAQGVIFERRSGFVLCEDFGMIKGTVTRLSKTFGFAKLDDGTEVFIPGRYFKGAMPGDTVLLHEIKGRGGESMECEVVKILNEGDSRFIGTIISEDGEVRIMPDTLTRNSIALSPDCDCAFNIGDKVLARISVRGERHSDHMASVVVNFGASGSANSCTRAVLALNDIIPEFPDEVIEEAKNAEREGLQEKAVRKRLDLRDVVIFTIDGADTKDIDDAVSVEKTADGYTLGVHIADVSHYVVPFSALDNEAMKRGTSIYYADSVIPMLPKELSNGICSLNPNEDRLAFSCFMKLDSDGKLISYKFSKSVIRSLVKGVYSEVNAILDGTASSEIQDKYAGVQSSLVIMSELADILTANKIKRGVPQIDTPECKLTIDDNGICTDVKRRERGRSELIIEEFMLMANTSAAKFARDKSIPCVYRVHEQPSAEKIEELKDVLLRMGIAVPHMKTVKPVHLAKILESAKGSSAYTVINSLVLRSMAKAKYLEEPLGHFGLVLDDYCHFTSPIRRYSDLAVHRIMTEIVENKTPATTVCKRFTGFAKDAAARASETELVAMKVERECDDRYIAEYMRNHLGDEYTATLFSMVDYGFYVELDNTVEGLVHVDSLTEGTYSYDGPMSDYTVGNKSYKIGDKLRVVCVKADVSSGNVDFVVAAEQDTEQ